MIKIEYKTILRLLKGLYIKMFDMYFTNQLIYEIGTVDRKVDKQYQKD